MSDKKFNVESSSDELVDKLYQKLQPLITGSVTQISYPPTQERGILFKSLKEAAMYYDVCYQSIEKQLDIIPHIRIGNSIKIYQNDLESALMNSPLKAKKMKGGKK